MANEEEAIAIEQAELDDESHVEELEHEEGEIKEVDGSQQQKYEVPEQAGNKTADQVDKAEHGDGESYEQNQLKDVQQNSVQSYDDEEFADAAKVTEHDTPTQLSKNDHKDMAGPDAGGETATESENNHTNKPPAKQKPSPQPKPVAAAQVKPALAPKAQSKQAPAKPTTTKQNPVTKAPSTMATAKTAGRQDKNGSDQPSEPAIEKPQSRPVPVKAAAPGRTAHVGSHSPTPPAEHTPVQKPSVPQRTMAPAPSRTQSQAALTSQMSKLTFSAAPNSATAKAMPRDSYSHTKFEVLKISEDNNKLCKRLLEISTSPGAGAITAQPPSRDSSASVNRRKREDRIAQENLAIYKRLQSVKPSTDISRGALDKHFAAQQAYGTNVRKFKARSPSPPRVPVSQPNDIHAATALYAAVTGIDGVATQQPAAAEQPIEQPPKLVEETLEQEEIADTVVTEPAAVEAL